MTTAARPEYAPGITAETARQFTPARAEQGFKSQADLDAFYVVNDHEHACPACQTYGAVWLEGDASWQPTMGHCDERARLARAWHAIRDA